MEMGSSGSGGGNQGLGTTGQLQSQQLQEALGSSAGGSAYSFSNGSIYTSSNGRGSAATGQMSTTYTLSGSQHLGQSNMSFQSLFGDDVLGSGTVVAETIDDTLDDEDLGGVIIGSYSTDDEELSNQMHLNGGGGDSSAEDELDV